jgi:cell division protein FtsQ
VSFSKRFSKKQLSKNKPQSWKTRQAYPLNSSPAVVEKNFFLPWRSIFFSVLLLIIAVSSGIVFYCRDQLLFPIKHIDVHGQFNTIKTENLQNVFAKYASGSLVFFSERQLKQALQAVPNVDQVFVKRIWPATVYVLLQQKYPVARFGAQQLLSNHGVLFAVSEPNQGAELPYINGPENRVDQLWQAYLALNKILSPLDLNILRLEVSSRLSYSLVLSNGIIIYLGSSDVAERLALFARVYLKSLQARAAQINYIDMRYNSGMAVSWKPSAAHSNQPKTNIALPV